MDSTTHGFDIVPMTTLPRIVSRRVSYALAIGSGALLLIGGCAQTRSASLTRAEIDVLTELDLGGAAWSTDLPAALTQAPALSLVAGDPIAIDCAIAGGYFDLGDDAPVYADFGVTGFE